MLPAAFLAIVSAYAGITAGNLKIYAIPIYIGVAVVYAVLLHVWITKRKLKTTYYVILSIILILSIRTESVLNSRYLLNIPQGQAVITGTVYKVSPKTEGVEILLKNCCVGEEKISFMIQMYTVDSGYTPGDKLLVDGKIKEFELPRNEGNFNQRQYYESIGVSYRCVPVNIVIQTKNENPFNDFSLKIRNAMRDSYNKITDEKDGGIYSSIILGDKSNLDDEVKDMYTKNGIAHILAISGVKTLCLVSPIGATSGLKWSFVRIHIVKKYIQNLCFKGQFLARCPSRFCGG